MTWSNPEFYYDFINLTCILNGKYNFENSHYEEYRLNFSFILERTNNKKAYLLLYNLLPGSNYTCWMITQIKSNNFSSSVKSQRVHQTTEPSNLSMHNFKLNDFNKSISFEYRLPKGFYDNFSISVIDLISNEEISSKIFHANLTHQLVFSQRYLTAGKSYKIDSKVNRFYQTSLKNLVSFSFKPDPITDLKIYTISKYRLNVTWKAPIYYEYFLVNTSFDQIKKTRLNWIELNDINITKFSLSVTSCSTAECDLISKYLTSIFDFDSSKILNFTQNLLGSNSLQLNFKLIDLHDIKSILFELLSLETNLGYNTICTYELHKNNNCSFSIDCVESKCSLKLLGLKYNSIYKIKLTPKSLFNFEFKSIEVNFKTKPCLPENDYKTYISYEIQSKIDSSLNVYFPNINQSNGSVMETCLLMVKLGNIKFFNQNDTFRINDLRNQKFLKNLYYSIDYCSNETVLYEPCLIKKLSYNEQRNITKIFILGKLDHNIRLNDLQSNLTFFNYEFIYQDLKESFNLYQLFFLFKIGDNLTELFLATYPTEPLQAKTNNTYIAKIKSQDGLWTVIILCIVSCAFLFGLIIILITLKFLRHKPSKFHKAAQINCSQHTFNPTGNLKSKYDDFLGFFNFFNNSDGYNLYFLFKVAVILFYLVNLIKVK